MTYRPPSRPPSGRWARLLHRERAARGWSQQQAFETLREGLHLGPKSRAAYAAIDMGDRSPTPDEARFLASFFGASPDDEPEPVAEPSLAAALTALAEELRLSREARESTEARLRAIEAELRSLAPRAGGALPGRSAPQTTAG